MIPIARVGASVRIPAARWPPAHSGVLPPALLSQFTKNYVKRRTPGDGPVSMKDILQRYMDESGDW